MPKLIDHAARMMNAHLSLEGLSVGDAFGERFFGPEAEVDHRLKNRLLPRPDWGWTDDTAMALSIVEELEAAGGIDQYSLANRFAHRHFADPMRGYGAGARQILNAIHEGQPWRTASAAAFDGQGSLGNGGAMRAAPIGAYFADDLGKVCSEAQRSAEVTHFHPEGQAGAIAVALAAAYALAMPTSRSPAEATLLQFVESRMPGSDTRLGIRKAIEMGPAASVQYAAAVLGVGHKVSAPDTVPFALWCASRHLDDYEEALWTTVSGLGDRDTTCAIVGGIVILKTGQGGLPTNWLESREPLPSKFRGPALDGR